LRVDDDGGESVAAGIDGDRLGHDVACRAEQVPFLLVLLLADGGRGEREHYGRNQEQTRGENGKPPAEKE